MNYKKLSKYIEHAQYYVHNRCTIREAAKYFKISKTTMHNHLLQVITHVRGALEFAVAVQLSENKEGRSKKGGQSTKLKWEAIRNGAKD